MKKYYKSYVLPIFFAICVLLGASYAESNSWENCFHNWNYGIRFFLLLILLSVIFYWIIILLGKGLDLCGRLKQKKKGLFFKLFEKHFLFKCTFLLLLFWAPFVLLCYPGGYCVDVGYQIAQVMGDVEYSTQQPLLHTLLVGGIVRFGGEVLGSYNKGLYLYILFQTVILAFSLAYGLFVLYKRGVSEKIIISCFLFYGLVPMFSNFATMAIKDTLFNAFIVVFIAGLIQLDGEKEKRSVRIEILVGCSALLFMLLRNNGLYIIVFTGLALIIVLLKDRRWKNRRRLVANVVILPVILFFILSGLMTKVTKAENVGSREMLSVLFQQTARYAAEYGAETPESEIAVIEVVLGEYDELAQLYDPNIADPIKSRYNLNTTNEELIDYLIVWGRQFLRHPDSYIQAFLNNSYGWFYPGVSNSVRYEAENNMFWRPGIMEKVERNLNNYYKIWDSIPIVGLTENAGFHVWVLLMLISYVWKRCDKRQLYLFAPAIISLLICILAPAFYLHVRYAFPIMFPMPILFGYVVNGNCRT